MILRSLMATVLLAFGVSAMAIDTDPGFKDPALQARYEHLIRELRCLVCQNNSIADSNATLAADLRRETREMLVAGKTDAEILKFMTDRYGDFVRYKPPLAPRTWLLWFAPIVLLIIGGIAAWRIVSRRTRLAATDTEEF